MAGASNPLPLPAVGFYLVTRFVTGAFAGQATAIRFTPGIKTT